MRPEKGKMKAKNTSLQNLRAPNWNNLNLEPFQKNFYREHPNVMNRLRHDVERFRNKHEITVQGLALNPIESFDEVFMPDYVAREIRNQGYNRPTPIQSQTWPIAFSGYNLVGIAQTGSGKTLAYILPAIVHINNQSNIKPGDGPIAVVLAPTRELAVQIQQVAIDFGSTTHIRTVCTVGGVDKKPQEADLRKGCEIVVATPGRLLDFLSANVTNMKRCTYLVLDEADRMLDMGFEAQIRQIISQIRPDKQILMWSATWPLEIRRLAEDFLGNYIQVNIGSLQLSANHNIKQFVHICQENEKSAKLQLLLRQIYQANNPGKILIFVSKKKRADMISKYINNFGVACESLHGDKPQSQRTKILDDFRSGRSNIIVATDVAARGLGRHSFNGRTTHFTKIIFLSTTSGAGMGYTRLLMNELILDEILSSARSECNVTVILAPSAFSSIHELAVDAKLQEIAFNPIKPEKIDKKQRRLNEISGFDVPAPEKRRHDGPDMNFSGPGSNTNFSGPGPSSTNTRDSYVGEPIVKRGRIDEFGQSGMMFNRNTDRDLIEKPINRGYMNIPATVCNPDQLDDRSIGLRPFDSRNNDRFETVDRAPATVCNPDPMNDRSIGLRPFDSRNNDRFETVNRGINLEDSRPTARSTSADRRMMELRRREFERPVAGIEQQFPSAGMNEYHLSDGQGPSDRQRFKSTEFERDEPSIGLGRKRNMREHVYDQRENDFGRQPSDFDRRENDFGRHENDFGRRENDFGRQESRFGRRENDLGRRDFDRMNVMNDFHDRSNDRVLRDSFDDIQGPIRDVRDIEDSRMGPTFDSSVSDRRNYEREMIGVRDAFSTRATNFQDNLQNRTFDMLSERRSVSQDAFRRLSPNPILDRSDINADRFLNQSHDDDAYVSLNQFGNRRDDFRDSHDSGFDMSDRRNDFIDDLDRDEPTSNRWNNDFAGREAYLKGQDRRNFGDDLRRQNDFSLGGEMNFNFARNNDYMDDDFPNRNRRDFERRNFDDRFNRFN
ncbi:hypothetical protein HA402_006492 [Bradysia odoriphaga]|nr:hypothetical protein HA402_006492 [Bradysia odoriphaga]